MPDMSAFRTPNPAVLRFRGLDLEAMTALQMRQIDAVRRMANLMFDSTETITERQAAFLRASVDQMDAALERSEDASDPKAIFESQSEAYRDLLGSLANHAGELAEIAARCCAGLVPEAAGKMTGLPASENRNGTTARTTGAISKSRAANT